MCIRDRRIGGVDAKKIGVVDETHLTKELMPRALEIAEELAQKDLKTYDVMKQMIKQNLARQIKMEMKG